MDKFIIDIQFVQGNHGQHFAKELAILKHGTIEPTHFFLNHHTRLKSWMIKVNGKINLSINTSTD